jgi:hypothetical protein
MTRTRRAYSRTRCFAHRHGIARTLNKSYMGGRYRTAYVETALPILALARYASGFWDVHVDRIERLGPLRRRWQLKVN